MKIFSPLRYAGGKTRVIESILSKFIPTEFEEFREPFVGGGSVFLYYKQLYPNRKFWINDLNYNLYCFWQMMKESPRELYESVVKYREIYKVRKYKRPEYKNINADDLKLATELYNICKDLINKDVFDRAVSYYILNKITYSGITEMSSLSFQAYNQNFTVQNARKILEAGQLLQDVKITNTDYADLFEPENKDIFYFLDPPYLINQYLYGKDDGDMHRGFDHERFFQQSSKLSQFCLTYNNHPWIVEKYKDFNISEAEYLYSIRRTNTKASRVNELIITTNEPCVQKLF
jgi:DNA adenine methylase